MAWAEYVDVQLAAPEQDAPAPAWLPFAQA